MPTGKWQASGLQLGRVSSRGLSEKLGQPWTLLYETGSVVYQGTIHCLACSLSSVAHETSTIVRRSATSRFLLGPMPGMSEQENGRHNLWVLFLVQTAR